MNMSDDVSSAVLGVGTQASFIFFGLAKISIIIFIMISFYIAISHVRAYKSYTNKVLNEDKINELEVKKITKKLNLYVLWKSLCFISLIIACVLMINGISENNFNLFSHLVIIMFPLNAFNLYQDSPVMW